MQILKIILWSIKEKNRFREVSFEPGKVNYVIGDSNTGKSSIWPIVDYCLGSSQLRVPIGAVRDKVSWYGVIFKEKDSKFLIARKNNTLNEKRSEWHFQESKDEILIPNYPAKNKKGFVEIRRFLSKEFEYFKNRLDENLLRSLENNNLGKLSYRDLLNVNHLIQYALVNPSELFIKDSDSISTMKLKKMFPTILYQNSAENHKVVYSEYKKQEERSQAVREEVNIFRNHINIVVEEAGKYGMKLGRSHIGLNIDELLVELNLLFSKYSKLLSSDYYKGNGSIDKTKINQIFILGRLKECISYSGIIRRSEELNFQKESLRLKAYFIRKRKENIQKEPQIMYLSGKIQKYAKLMQLDFIDLIPFYDEIDSMLKFKNQDSNVVTLAKLGSTRNFVGYNIALFLSLHEIFIKNKQNYIFPFLFIDQPSQGFSMYKNVNDKLDLLLETIDFAVGDLNKEFQVIVLDRQIPNRLKKMYNSHIVEKWINDKSLIPKHW